MITAEFYAYLLVPSGTRSKVTQYISQTMQAWRHTHRLPTWHTYTPCTSSDRLRPVKGAAYLNAPYTEPTVALIHNGAAYDRHDQAATDPDASPRPYGWVQQQLAAAIRDGRETWMLIPVGVTITLFSSAGTVPALADNAQVADRADRQVAGTPSDSTPDCAGTGGIRE